MREHGVVGQDYKSALQEHLQSHDRPLPDYRLTGTVGPDHRKQFLVEVVVDGEALAQASGPSKKEAEQEAARLALEQPHARRRAPRKLATSKRVVVSRHQSISMMPQAFLSSSGRDGAAPALTMARAGSACGSRGSA